MSFEFSPVTEVRHLDDVDVSGVADGESLTWDDATSTWVADNPSVDATAVRDAGRWEVVVDGVPASAVMNEAEDDWVYGWVSD